MKTLSLFLLCSDLKSLFNFSIIKACNYYYDTVNYTCLYVHTPLNYSSMFKLDHAPYIIRCNSEKGGLSAN